MARKIPGYKKLNLITFVFFIFYFLGICFVTTANIFLFAQGTRIPEEIIRTNAPKIIINIFVLSFLFTAITYMLGYSITARPVRKILNFTDRVAKGNYRERLSVRGNGFDPHGYEVIKENLNEMVEELNSVETLRTDFISNVSHELKTPLTVIQNYATLIQSPSLSEEEKNEYSRQIVNQTSRLSALITNILKLNKLENQKIFPTLTQVNMSELVCECMLNFENAWEEKNLYIETELSDDLLFYTDPELIKIVVNNLISNAVKFTENGGTVGIKVSSSDGKNVVISIQDTGCGMDSRTGNHIFEKFYQGETSHTGQGNGLGLALVKRIVDILGYEINVESEIGVGSTFTLICR